MRLLLDTHAFLCAAADKERLGKKARAVLTDFDNEVFVSAATAWEITTKFRLGKLPEAQDFVFSFKDSVRRLGFSELSVSVDHAQRAGLLAGEHKDPFDRMLIAQSLIEGLALVSNEKRFDTYPIHRIW